MIDHHKKKPIQFFYFPICDFSQAALRTLLNQTSGGLGQHSKVTGFPCSTVEKILQFLHNSGFLNNHRCLYMASLNDNTQGGSRPSDKGAITKM